MSHFKRAIPKATLITGFSDTICIASPTIGAITEDTLVASRDYTIYVPPFNLRGFLNFIFRGVRAHPEPPPFLCSRAVHNPRGPASRRYIMRNSYRDVAYHCSGKQRNPITGWQLNSLSPSFSLSLTLTLSLSGPCFSCGRRSESSRPRSRDQPPRVPCSPTPSRSTTTERTKGPRRSLFDVLRRGASPWMQDISAFHERYCRNPRYNCNHIYVNFLNRAFKIGLGKLYLLYIFATHTYC